MQPLTPDVWADRFADLRPLVTEEFPQLPDQDLESIGGDWDGLVEVLQRTLALDADVVRQRLTTIDVDEAPGSSSGRDRSRASVEQIRVAVGFAESEHDRVREVLRKLDRRLRTFPAEAVDAELSIKDRDTTSQKVTLEVWLPKLGHLVATSKESDVHDALMDLRSDMFRQIDEAVNRRKPY